MTEIKGNTYPVRWTIKSMGFTWNKRGKSWERALPLTPDEDNRLNEIRGIIVQVFRGNGEIIHMLTPDLINSVLEGVKMHLAADAVDLNFIRRKLK